MLKNVQRMMQLLGQQLTNYKSLASLSQFTKKFPGQRDMTKVFLEPRRLAVKKKTSKMRYYAN